jgi:acetylornithine deacetylase
VLAGHTDTVPYDEGKWKYNPFALTRSDRRLYGLGTSDMKSFLALSIDALRELGSTDLDKPVILLATADEETGMAGARALVAHGTLRARHAVIGEPTSLRPVRMHKGIMMEAIRLRGRSGHSSDPALGNNALEAMHRVIHELLAWRSVLQEKYHAPQFAVPVPTLNLGHIHGGDNPNRICPDCELHIDLRPLPGMAIQELRAELRHRITTALQNTGIEVTVTPLIDGVPPLETRADSEIIRITEKLTGCPSEAVAFATEAPYLQQLGIDTVVLGPGDIEQAHQPDEYLALDRLEPTTQLLRKLVKTVCT